MCVDALHHHAPVAHEAGQNRQRDVGVEAVSRVDLGNMVIALAERRHLQIRIDAEYAAGIDQTIRLLGCGLHYVPLLFQSQFGAS